MKQTILFLFISIALFSCHKKNEAQPQDLCAEPAIENNTCTSDSNQIKVLILGKWNWTQQINSWNLAKSNPCTDTVNFTYEFLNNGTVKYSKNGTYVSTGIYHFDGTTLYANDSFVNFGLNGWTSICNNYLIIDDMPVDGPRDIYVKAQ